MKKLEDIMVIFSTIVMVILVAMVIFLVSPNLASEDKIDIESATIDDSVSMNEFLDKYEILDQEGKIYTVKERE